LARPSASVTEGMLRRPGRKCCDTCTLSKDLDNIVVLPLFHISCFDLDIYIYTHFVYRYIQICDNNM
jgi:hypothetical protein